MNCVFPELPQSQACLQAGQALYDAGRVVYISLIVRMEYWQHHLEALIASFPRVVELPLSLSVLQAGVDLMGRYALHSQDAVHLATALHYEIPVFWTCDGHFSRADDLLVEVIRDPN